MNQKYIIISFIILDLVILILMIRFVFGSLKKLFYAIIKSMQSNYDAYFDNDQNNKMDSIIKLSICLAPIPILIIWELVFLGYIKI